jgi:hypothetical protein
MLLYNGQQSSFACGRSRLRTAAQIATFITKFALLYYYVLKFNATYCNELVVVWLIKTRFWIGYWIYLRLTAYNFNYNLQLCSRQFSIAVYIALSVFYNYSMQFTIHVLSYLGQLSHNSSLIPASNGGRSLSWVPELSPHHTHSDFLITVCSLELHLELPPLELSQIPDRSFVQ